jgi:polygalacturonase
MSLTFAVVLFLRLAAAAGLQALPPPDSTPDIEASRAAAAAEAALWSASGWYDMAHGGNSCDVKEYGAVGDNATDDTLAIQKAIDGCRSKHPLAAVVVLSGPAAYRVTASMELGSNLTLLIDKETVLFSAKTPPAPCNETLARLSGTTCAAMPPYTPMKVAQNPRCPTLYWARLDTAVLCGANLTNIAILGADQNTSVVDGGGAPWYWRWSQGLDGPRLFEVAWSSNITLAHVTFRNSASWTIHPTFCDGVLAHNIRILNPRWVGNTDGFGALATPLYHLWAIPERSCSSP